MQIVVSVENLRDKKYYCIVTKLLNCCNRCSFVIDCEIASQISFLNKITLDNPNSVISKQFAPIHPNTGTWLNGEMIVYCLITKFIKSQLLQSRSFDVWNNDQLPGEMCFYCDDTFVLGIVTHEKMILINDGDYIDREFLKQNNIECIAC